MVCSMPVGLQLEFVSVVGVDVFDAERELNNYVVQKSIALACVCLL